LEELESRLFSALAHPARLHILELLRGGETCVCHIQAVLGHRQAYVSQQLMALRDAGMVARRKEGLRTYYRLSHPRLPAVLDAARSAVREGHKGQTLVQAGLAPRGSCRCPQCAPDLA
ncbi:MAG: ArsR/SmtB family transcription factor, partial [Anaerolineales bacterium]